jgi:thiamine-phosphate pyrophosphorylase
MAADLFRLYLVTDRGQTRGRPLLDVIELALQGGVDAVQLREKDLPARELFHLATQLRKLCADHGARLLINDRIDVALAVGADGVHLPANSFAPSDARTLLGPHALIGASAHGLAEARAAAHGGADFIIFGPIFDTPSKRPFGPPLGLEALASAARQLALPIFAIGGMTRERGRDVRQRGAHDAAVISAVLSADDPRRAAAALRAALQVETEQEGHS